MYTKYFNFPSFLIFSLLYSYKSDYNYKNLGQFEKFPYQLRVNQLLLSDSSTKNPNLFESENSAQLKREE